MDKNCKRHLRPAARFTLTDDGEDFEYLCEECVRKSGSSESFPIGSFNVIREFGTRNYQSLYFEVKKQRKFIDQLRSLNSQCSNTARVEIAAYLKSLSDWVETRSAFFEHFLNEAEGEIVSLLDKPSSGMSSASTILLSLQSESYGIQLVQDLYKADQLKAELEPYYDFMVSGDLRKQELIEDLVSQTRERAIAQGKQEVKPIGREDPALSETASTQPSSNESGVRRAPGPGPREIAGLGSIPPSESDDSESIEEKDPVPTQFPIFNSGDKVKRLDLSLRSSSEPFRCKGLDPEFTFTEYIAFVLIDPSTYFVVGAGVSKRLTARINLETGEATPFPELDKERGSCGLLFYRGDVYLFGGYGGSKYGLTRHLVMAPPFQNTDKINVFPGEEKWKSLAEMPTSRYGFTPARYRKKVFLVGGWDSAGRVDQYDIKSDRYQTLSLMRGPERVASSCICGTTLVTISQQTMWKWDLSSGDGSYSEHEEKTLTEAVDDLWSNMIPIYLGGRVYYMHIPGSRMIVLDQQTGQIEIRRLR